MPNLCRYYQACIEIIAKLRTASYVTGNNIWRSLKLGADEADV